MRAQKLGTDIRRAQIAEATLKVVGERGLRGLSTAAVAAEVGLAPSALFRHFPGVEEMLGAAMVLLHEQVNETFAVLSEEAVGPLDVLKGFFFPELLNIVIRIRKLKPPRRPGRPFRIQVFSGKSGTDKCAA